MQDADEDFSMLLTFPPDYPLADLYALSERLADTDVCVPGYVPPPIGLFHPDGYFYDQHIERSKTILIPDRNVVSRMAQLARGRPVEADQQVRAAAGLLAFAQCLDIEIEPSVAFHELAHTATTSYSAGPLPCWPASTSRPIRHRSAESSRTRTHRTARQRSPAPAMPPGT